MNNQSKNYYKYMKLEKKKVDENRLNNIDFDVVVVGAGFAGLYMLHRLRIMGFSTKVFESAEDVGGTWYYNRYPGARCDIMSIDYSYSFDAELESEWQWSEKYATQPEILRYLQHVTTKFDLRKDIQFSTRIKAATFNEKETKWQLQTNQGDEVSCRFYVMATGCLSVPKSLDIEGVDKFGGTTYMTGRWPHEPINFSGMRVAVIGTGSSGIQAIPLIAEQASKLTVFQRTANYSIPARNGQIDPKRQAKKDADIEAYREAARWSIAGVPEPVSDKGAMQVSEEERQAKYEEIWSKGELVATNTAYNDLLVNPISNETISSFVREKVRAKVTDPKVAELLSPKHFPLSTKRLCLDTNYYETFNLPHVRLVDLRQSPITTITEKGIDTSNESFEFDVIVFATGFDAMTGALTAVDIRGRNDLKLRDKWSAGPSNYLGLMSVGFPNLFMVTGPGSPSVLSNMVISIEQHVEWISDCIDYLRKEGLHTIEPTKTAEAGWVQHANDYGSITLASQVDSWYIGANVPGKPRVFYPYVGGVDVYRKICGEVVNQDYLGFTLNGPEGTRENDGIIRRIKPDVQLVLDFLETLGLPEMNTMPAADARNFSDSLSAERPPGPEVGEIIDGVFPGAVGDLDYRLYRPASSGPHPIVLYFHGGGWVLGSTDSDDPFCRDLCVRSNAIIISVDYRHAPEAKFPAAPDDGFAALQWVSSNAIELGGIQNQLVVAGWSAGANIAAVVCQMARDAKGPKISGQMLVTPVTDCDFSRSSYIDNANGYVLTADLMKWFWDHYAKEVDRKDPKASPLRAESLADLPPALVVTCEFDPLRDEGEMYAKAMAEAGVKVQHLPCSGHIHTSLHAVDVVISGMPIREKMGISIRNFFTS